jgi:flagellar biosynthesis protein FlhG
MGLANVDVLLGLDPRNNLSHVLQGQLRLEDVVVTGPAGVMVVPASSGVRQMADLSPEAQVGLIAAFNALPAPLDTLLIDSASGISESVLTFARASQEVVVVVCDEPASITDAYALIKVLRRDYQVERFQVVASRVRDSAHGRRLHDKLARVAERFLDVSLCFLGEVPDDDCVRRALQAQQPVVDAYPGSRAAAAYRRMAERVQKLPFPDAPSGYLELFVERLIKSRAGEQAVSQ